LFAIKKHQLFYGNVMAIQKKHEDEYIGRKGFVNEYFGKDGYGTSYLRNVWRGATTPFHFLADDGYITGMFGCFLLPVLVMGASGIYVAETNDGVDLNLSAQLLTQEEVVESGITTRSFQYSGERILLQENSAGDWAVYKDRSLSDIDDEYVLVKNADDALDLAQKYRGHFEEVSYALNHDLGDMPDTVPYTISYEGFTASYEDGGDIYVLADNMEQQARGISLHILTAPSAMEAYETWKGLADDIVRDGYNPIERLDIQAVEQETPFEHGGLQGLQLLATLYGSAMGLGAVGGAASATSRSRKRFNRELGR
jgi:hypothetical protein